MTRTWPAIAACALAIGVLLALIYASRPLDVQAYEQHHNLLTAITNTADSYQSLLEHLSLDRRDVVQLASGIATLRARLEQGRQEVTQAAASAGTDSDQYTRYTDTLATVISSATEAEQQLPALRRAMTVLREDGPATVQRLRETSDDDTAQRFYSLWLNVYEYGFGNAADKAGLQQQLAEVAGTGAGLNRSLAEMSGAMKTVLTGREPLETSIRTIRQTGFNEAAAALATHYRAQHAASVDRRNDARVLVALYSLLLFAGLGFVMYRLHSSNRELNLAHERMQEINTQLEDHVQARTRDVHKAHTDLQKSQVQLVHAEKLSSLGRLVAGISHEINTPLAYLHSNTTLNKETLLRIEDFLGLCYQRLSPRRRKDEPLEDTRARITAGLKDLRKVLVEGEVREELREVIALTEDNLKGLEELTWLAQGLKDFSRIDDAPIDRFDVNDGVERTLTMARNMLKNRVTVTSDLGEVPPIYCAPSQINQVLLNLITNASQAIEGKGEIAISTFVEHESVVVRIRDSGNGIRPQIMNRIRDPFFTTKQAGSGTGLGLSIVEEILGKHNGRLDIESTPGQGSAFSVYLPVDRRTGQTADTKDNETASALTTLSTGPEPAPTAAVDPASANDAVADDAVADDAVADDAVADDAVADDAVADDAVADDAVADDAVADDAVADDALAKVSASDSP